MKLSSIDYKRIKHCESCGYYCNYPPPLPKGGDEYPPSIIDVPWLYVPAYMHRLNAKVYNLRQSWWQFSSYNHLHTSSTQNSICFQCFLGWGCLNYSVIFMKRSRFVKSLEILEFKIVMENSLNFAQPPNSGTQLSLCYTEARLLLQHVCWWYMMWMDSVKVVVGGGHLNDKTCVFSCDDYSVCFK